MHIDVYTSTGTKSGSVELPESIFGAEIRTGLMHLALVRQQSNRRIPIAHVKHRGEVVGSTKKVYQQKGTGRARRGPIRSPLMRGGGKAFGPRSEANFVKDMPREMRRQALRSCLSWQAKKGGIIALKEYPNEVKTKAFATLLGKMPIDDKRRIVVVLATHHRGIEMSARNIPGVKTLMANYLNPEDILLARKVVFMVDAIKVAEEVFGKKKERSKKHEKMKKSEKIDEVASNVVKKPKTTKKKAPTSAKKSSSSSSSSSSSASK